VLAMAGDLTHWLGRARVFHCRSLAVALTFGMLVSGRERVGPRAPAFRLALRGVTCAHESQRSV
jgi:hypothetical protein